MAGVGVLLGGSGSVTHNLRRVFAGGLRPDADAPATPESTAFRDWCAESAVAAGAAGRQPARRIHASLTYGDLGMDAYAFGPGAARFGTAEN